MWLIDTFYEGSQPQFHGHGRPHQTLKREEFFICRAEKHHNAWRALHTGKRKDWPLLHLSFCIPSSQMTVGGIMGHSHCELFPEWKTARLGPKNITVNSSSHLSIY
jgi:hypothetical protein